MRILKELIKTFQTTDTASSRSGGEIGCLETGSLLEISRYSSSNTNNGEMFYLDDEPIFLVPDKCGQASKHLEELILQGKAKIGFWIVMDCEGSFEHFESYDQALDYADQQSLTDDSCCIEFITQSA